MRFVFQIFSIAVMFQQAVFGAPLTLIDDDKKCLQAYNDVINAFNSPQPVERQTLQKLHKLFSEGDENDIPTHAGILRVAFSNDANQLVYNSASAFARPAKAYARAEIRKQSHLAPEVLLLLDLDETIDAQRELKSKDNAKLFFERFAKILKNQLNKFDGLREAFKNRMIKYFIVQLQPWSFSPEILCLEDLEVDATNQPLLQALQGILLNKYSELPTLKDYAASFFNLMDTSPFSVLVAIFIVSKIIQENGLTNIAAMLCSSVGTSNVTLPQNVSSNNSDLENLSALSQKANCTFEYSEEPKNYTVVNLATAVVVCFYILRVIYEGLKIYSNFVFSSMYKTIDLELQWLLLYIKEQNNPALADAFKQSAPTILKKF